jgi:MSHA biogenesis protein MshK
MAHRMNSHTCFAALFVAAFLASSPARAQSGLVDPTRPPAAGAVQGTEEAPAGRQLQSVLLSGGRKVAVIDGAMVPLGGMLGDARVIRISESEVVLKTGEETETLKLFPGVDKKAVKRSTRARAGTPGTESMQGGQK